MGVVTCSFCYSTSKRASLCQLKENSGYGARAVDARTNTPKSTAFAQDFTGLSLPRRILSVVADRSKPGLADCTGRDGTLLVVSVEVGALRALNKHQSEGFNANGLVLAVLVNEFKSIVYIMPDVGSSKRGVLESSCSRAGRSTQHGLCHKSSRFNLGRSASMQSLHFSSHLGLNAAMSCCQRCQPFLSQSHVSAASFCLRARRLTPCR